jgi:flagellar assembly protein FliH
MSAGDRYAFPQLERRPTRGGGSPSERAAAIVAQAEADAAAIAADATRAGHEEGFTRGLAEARELLEPGRLALAEAAQGIAAAQEVLAAELEQRAVELALAIAEKVLHAALGVRPELVVEVVKGALRRVAERDRLVVQVNPDDLELVQASLDDIAGSFGGLSQLELAGERRVPRGGCVVRTEAGEIDAQIEEQLGRAEEVLRGAFERMSDA